MALQFLVGRLSQAPCRAALSWHQGRLRFQENCTFAIGRQPRFCDETRKGHAEAQQEVAQRGSSEQTQVRKGRFTP
jgi:hypothetical protein